MKLFIAVLLLGLLSYGYGQIQCGNSNMKINPLIVGGSDANKGQFPWQVAVQGRSQGIWFIICGGTLVTDGTNLKVISAAHCFSSTRVDNYRVIFGLHLRSQQNTNPGDTVTMHPSRIINHPSYDDRAISNDLSILEFSGLNMGVLASTFAQPACLPSVAALQGEIGIVSGWGTIQEGTATYKDALQYVLKSLITREKCEETGNKGYLDDTMICGGVAGQDACQGDSGGPLVVQRNTLYELVGIVSWGFGCGRPNYPGVYSDVYNILKAGFVCDHFNCQ